MNTKILFVEDDKEVVETVLLIFNYHWPEAHIIHSFLGKPGIELARHENPEAIILDLGLPDISGFEVLRNIRQFSSIPIIVLTAHTAEDEIVKALEEEATDYITKPFRHRELLARVQSHVSHWKMNEIRRITQRNQ
ncbi:MAG TPA: response regulator [Dehalococcoidales bacterium]|nr:response regulator [Dehalococcoidales bacterium]